MRGISLEHFASLLSQCYAQKTSARPRFWSRQNPSYGHCALVVIAVHDYFGATMYCGDIPFEIAYKHKTGFLSHCWNKLNGEVVDLTRAQFSPEFPHGDLVAGRLGAIKKISKEVLLTDSLLAQNYMAFSRLLSPLLAKTRGHKP